MRRCFIVPCRKKLRIRHSSVTYEFLQEKSFTLESGLQRLPYGEDYRMMGDIFLEIYFFLKLQELFLEWLYHKTFRKLIQFVFRFLNAYYRINFFIQCFYSRRVLIHDLC